MLEHSIAKSRGFDDNDCEADNLHVHHEQPDTSYNNYRRGCYAEDVQSDLGKKTIDVETVDDKKDFDMPVDCCSFKENYRKLMIKYDQNQETISQLERNLTKVTEQLVSRDQLFLAHMNRTRNVVSKLEEQWTKTSGKGFLSNSKKPLMSLLEPRGSLKRRPVCCNY